MMSRRRFLMIVALLAWLAFIWALGLSDRAHGLLWLVSNQLYYQPYSWLGAPYFVYESDIGFWVQWPGRIVAAIAYTGLFFLVATVVDRRRARSAADNSSGGA